MGRPRVFLAPAAARALRRVPRHIREKFEAWVEAVQTIGLEEVRRVPGFHDEPLGGRRSGQRSIRLSRGYRAIYVLESDAELRVEEVSKHGY